MKGSVKIICISPAAGEPMQEVNSVEAVAGQGLKGDRYGEARGSYNKDKPGVRQVTFMNAAFFEDGTFRFQESRRNVLVEGTELMQLIGKEFQFGAARFRGVKYCDPCSRPSNLSGNPKNFKEAFLDRGGLIAEVIEGGLFAVGDELIRL